MALVKDVYTLTREFPKEEVYGLVSQMRRAAVSIPSNPCRGGGEKWSEGIRPVSRCGQGLTQRAGDAVVDLCGTWVHIA